MKPKKLLLSLLLGGLATTAGANNIQVGNVRITGQNTASDFSLVNFDLTWENSWRTSTNESNYDGAWVFVKFRKKNAFAWQHATLNYGTGGTAAASGHTQPAGSVVQTAADGKGVWIYRNADGAGTVNYAGTQLRWNYGADGLADNDSVEVKVMAIEMVYVPQGAYFLGSNGTEANHFRRGDKDTTFRVLSEGAITVGTAAANLTSTNTATLGAGTIAASYPKGFNAFWMMKHEISQQQYADFLNTLDLASSNKRHPGSFTTGTHPALVPNQPERAMSNLSATDVLSLLDWSGLRPMTEMEFEKAARGANQVPVPNEYAWGNTTVAPIATPTDQGLSTETWGSGNAAYNTNTPMRSGALATATSNRQQSGASFYGILELSGNLLEVCINANTSGRTYTAVHGDGNLSPATEYDAATWPTVPAAVMHRGGSYLNNSAYLDYLTISNRTYATYGSAYLESRISGDYGGRGVRSAE